MNHYTPHPIAAVNFIREDSWCLYANGYRRAAEILIANLDSTYDVNTVVFPILYNYRQYIELTLKETIAYGRELVEKSTISVGGHDLEKLWMEAKAHIKKHCSHLSNEEIENIGCQILDFHSMDPTSERSRYPVIKKGKGVGRKASFSWDSPNIKLNDLARKMKVIGDFLDEVTNYLSVAADFNSEFRYEIEGQFQKDFYCYDF